MFRHVDDGEVAFDRRDGARHEGLLSHRVELTPLRSLALLSLVLIACGDPLVQVSQRYEDRARFALAREYLRDQHHPDALVRSEARYTTWLEAQRDTADARGDQSHALASQLRLLEVDGAVGPRQEATRRMQALAEVAEASFDRRMSRGEPSVADYVACRRTAALSERAETLARCDALKNSLKQWLLARVTSDVTALGDKVRLGVASELHDGKHELIATAPDENHATLELSLEVFGRGTVIDEPDVEVRRQPVRGMVPTGKKEKVVVPPTEQELADAKKKNEKPPAPKEVERALYRPATGEYRYFQGARQVRRPYTYALHRMRDAHTLFARDGWIVVRHTRRFFEYTGDPKLRDDPSGWNEGSGGTLPSEAALREGAEARLIDEVVTDVLALVEKDLR